jgi:hypothetical protein
MQNRAMIQGIVPGGRAVAMGRFGVDRWACGGLLTAMRLWHIVVAILALAIMLSIGRDQVGRIALIVFVTALGEVIIGTTAVLALFRTIGSIGEAKGLFGHAEAVATTTLVLILATAIMSSWLFAGAWLVQNTLP